MACLEHYYTQFEEGLFYHVYNRSVDRQPMFRNKGNYLFFLSRYEKYLSPVLETYAYCLLNNHFHLLVRVKEGVVLGCANAGSAPPRFDNFNKVVKSGHPGNELPGTKTTHDIVSHQFRKFFQSYAMAFNKQQNRIGTLFQTPFKRALVSSDAYLQQLVDYIHFNPQKHGLINDYREWSWSSYHQIVTATNHGFSRVVI